MKRASTLVLVWFCVVILATGCSTAADDTHVSDGAATTTDAVQGTDANASGDAEAALSVGQRGGWFTSSLEDFDILMASADGYVYYYTFEDLPPGLPLELAAARSVMNECVLDFRGEGGRFVHLAMFSASGEPDDLGDVKVVTLDGEVYYYHEDYDEETGAYLGGIFIWFKDGVQFWVDPGVPITEEVIRRYSKLRKVEFNKGQEYVGFGSGVPLIADPEKMKSLVRENPGIKYRTGKADPKTGDDLLEP